LDVVVARHGGLRVAEFVSRFRGHNVAVAYADSDEPPAIANVTADLVSAWLQRIEGKYDSGYATVLVDQLAGCARVWQSGGTPEDHSRIDKRAAPKTLCPAFIYMISGATIRAPAAAMALLERITG
jgi:hypothetical protein